MTKGSLLEIKLVELGVAYGNPRSAEWIAFRKAVLDAVKAHKNGRFNWKPAEAKHKQVFGHLDAMEKAMKSYAGSDRPAYMTWLIVRASHLSNSAAIPPRPFVQDPLERVTLRLDTTHTEGESTLSSERDRGRRHALDRS